MDKTSNNIDKFFREKLSGLEADGSSGLWRKIYFLLIYKKLLFWGLTVLILIAGIFFFYKASSVNEKNARDNTGAFLTDSTFFMRDSESGNTTNNLYDQTISESDNAQKNNMIGQSSDSRIEESVESQKTIKKDAKQDVEQDVDVSINVKTGQGMIKTDAGQSDNANAKLSAGSPVLSLMTLPVPPFNTVDNVPFIITPEQPIENNNTGHDGEPGPKQKKIFLSIEASLNPAYITTAQSCECVDPADNIYNESGTKGIFTLGGAAGVTANINGFFLKTGLEYASYGHDDDYSYATDEIDNEQSYFEYDTTWAWVYDPPEIYQYPLSIDSSFVTIYKTENISAKNRFNCLEIPLLFGYSFLDDKKVSFEFSTGCSFGFLISASGSILSPYDKTILDLNKSQGFIQNSSINYIAQMGIGFKLTPKAKFILRPVYKRSLRSTFENGFPLKQKFNTFGISLGFNVKF